MSRDVVARVRGRLHFPIARPVLFPTFVGFLLGSQVRQSSHGQLRMVCGLAVKVQGIPAHTTDRSGCYTVYSSFWSQCPGRPLCQGCESSALQLCGRVFLLLGLPAPLVTSQACVCMLWLRGGVHPHGRQAHPQVYSPPHECLMAVCGSSTSVCEASQQNTS